MLGYFEATARQLRSLLCWCSVLRDSSQSVASSPWRVDGYAFLPGIANCDFGRAFRFAAVSFGDGLLALLALRRLSAGVERDGLPPIGHLRKVDRFGGMFTREMRSYWS